VGWSKTYLLLTHTTCLTKHKPKGNEEKQKREAKTGSAVKKKQNNVVNFFFHQMKYAKSMMRRFENY
jgi:hypothetical protein